jgi:hypothetical protein
MVMESGDIRAFSIELIEGLQLVHHGDPEWTIVKAQNIIL